jgi:prefoldin subunit 5
VLAEEVSRLSAQLRRTEKRLEMTKGRIAELETTWRRCASCASVLTSSRSRI